MADHPVELPLGGRGPSNLVRIRARLERAGMNRQLAIAALAPLIGAAVTLWLVIPTLAPGVLSQAGGDTAEFQTVAWVLGTAHPTGYPSYIILGFLFTHLFPFGDPAFRLNILQALLGASAVAGTIAIVRLLTGMRWIALATGLLLLVMPTFTPGSAAFPSESIQTSPVFWRLSTYADPHMFHLALVTLIFLLLLVWERRRNDADPERQARADRWLIAAAGTYGVALANHSLTLMLAPGIGLFVLAVAPRLILNWRLILTSLSILVATAVAFWLELPIRAAMHAPLVYAHPDTWSGFLYVITGQQFGGIPPTIGADIGLKYAAAMNLMASWLGPLSYLAVLGIGTSLVKRPRFVLLALMAAALTSGFAAAYVNSDLERYFLVPVFVAYTFVGLGVADIVPVVAWAAESAGFRPRSVAAPDAAEATTAGPSAAEPPGAEPRPSFAATGNWQAPVLMAVEAVIAIALLASNIVVAPDRQQVQGAGHTGGVSQATQDYRQKWLNAVLAAPDKGGLPADSVIVSNWSDSTSLWYGQLAEGLRPDVYVVDDSMRVAAGDNLGDVWDVIDTYLSHRPVFLLRFPWNCDGMDSLVKFYEMTDYPLPNGASIKEVTGKIGPVTCS